MPRDSQVPERRPRLIDSAGAFVVVLRACLRSLQYVKLRLLPEGVIMSHSYSSDISREQFARILPCLESARPDQAPHRGPVRRFCGVLYLLKSGCQWRMLPADFPDWRTCYKYFRQWSERPDPAKYSILEQVLKKSVGAARRSNGRKERTSFCIVDSQSVKNTDSAENKGYDSGKKVSGIKRHIAVDTQGLPHAIHVTTANVTDRAGALAMFDRRRANLSQVQNVLVDGGYTGNPLPRRCRACWELRWKW